MINLTLPNWLSKHLKDYNPGAVPTDILADLRSRLRRYHIAKPEISIVIPAYNEEANLLKTLSSLADQQLSRPTELLVVNNNSTDRTQELLDLCGVRSIIEKKPGVAHARQAGLMAAKGRIIANADADCLYPATWVDAITAPLQNPAIGTTYGLYSFLPSPNSSRVALEFYEKLSHTANLLRSANKPYLNVYGFNFAFRREDALKVGGFALDTGREGSLAELVAAGQTPPPSGRCEDGWMALSIAEQGKGTIYRVSDAKAHAWTSDRRLIADGSLGKAFSNRIKRELNRFSPIS
jgi:hypothetical protein